MTSRRDFVARLTGLSAVVVAAGSRRAAGQQRNPTHDSSLVRDSTNLFAMDQAAARPVRRPPKPGAVPVVAPADRDALEHRLHCQCGCTLDVFTCRTTDFSCQVSPAMHRDVMALVDGGYSAQEIIDAFVDTYGERALMAPKTSGFDLLAWLTPGIVVVVVGGLLAVLLRRWRAESGSMRAAAAESPASYAPPDATPEELARLTAAVKSDDE